MKQTVTAYSYSPTTNVVTLTGVNIDQDQLLLVVAPQVGRTMYNFAGGVTGSVVAGADTRVTLNASTAGLTTTSPLVIFYDDHSALQAVTGTVALDAASLAALENVTVTVGNVTIGSSVSISNFPASQSVTFSQASTTFGAVTGSVSVLNFPATQTVSFGAITGSVSLLGTPAVTGTVELGPNSLSALESITVTMGSVTVTGGLTDAQLRASAVTVAGTVTVGNSVTIGSLPAISGTVTANASNGTLTTRFGTPTTANTAFATSAVTNANRKYLLIQNVTTGSNVITVGIGFTPTTTQGIQLTAGAGITFESSYIPTGAVQILSSVTQSNFTILEA